MNIILKKQLIIIKKLPIDLGCASVNRNSWGSDPKSLGVIRFAYYPRDQSLFKL